MKSDFDESDGQRYARWNAALHAAEDEKCRSIGTSLDDEVEKASERVSAFRSLNSALGMKRRPFLQPDGNMLYVMTYDREGSVVLAKGSQVASILRVFPQYVRIIEKYRQDGYFVQDEVVDFLGRSGN